MHKWSFIGIFTNELHIPYNTLQRMIKALQIIVNITFLTFVNRHFFYKSSAPSLWWPWFETWSPSLHQAKKMLVSDCETSNKNNAVCSFLLDMCAVSKIKKKEEKKQRRRWRKTKINPLRGWCQPVCPSANLMIPLESKCLRTCCNLVVHYIPRCIWCIDSCTHWGELAGTARSWLTTAESKQNRVHFRVMWWSASNESS